MASRFDKQLEQILKGDVSSLVEGLPDTDDSEHISEPEELLPVAYEHKETSLALGNQDLQEDYESARSNLYGLMGRSNAALDLALRISVMSENPRALEVAATLIKMSGELSKDLIGLHKTIESGKGKGNAPDKNGQYTQINNNYYGDKEQATKIIDDLPDDDDDGEE